MNHRTIIGSVILYAVLLAAVSFTPARAQVKGSGFLDRMESARKLYINGSYFAAEKAFQLLSEEVGENDNFDRAEIESYKVLCAIALDKVNAAGMVKVFCDKYPNAPQIGMVKYTYGSRLFNTGNYKEALETFKTIKKEHVYKGQRMLFEFRKAYCNMRVGNLDEAGNGYASILKEGDRRFRIPATYYMGFILYSQKKFDEAVPYFEESLSDKHFELMSRYYAVESKFMLKDYDYVIEQGPAFFPRLEGDLKFNMARILSEAYYEKDDSRQAQQYLDIYGKKTDGFSRKDNYLSGMLAYNLGDYKSALDSFGKVMGEDDELSQNAHYYTANVCLKNRNKVKALSEFKAAADMDFDKVIKEDAWFNFAKLSFDVNSDISQFGKYIEIYPGSDREDVINSYIGASFLRSADYLSAVKALGKVKKHSAESTANLQKAAFFSAMKMVEGRNYTSASDYLQTAIRCRSGNDELTRLSRYWLAECSYHNQDYASAIEINNSLIEDDIFRLSSEYPTALYNQGYAYLKNNDFLNSRDFFNRYLVNGSFVSDKYEHDAKVRLADTYFLAAEYPEAAFRYEDIYFRDSVGFDVYPAIQAARSYAHVGNSSKRLAILKHAGRESRGTSAYPLALFELGRAYKQSGQPNDASSCFFTILGMEQDSTYYAKSLLELADINVSMRRYDRAMEYCKEVVEDVPYSPEVPDAISMLESIYSEVNRPEEFLAYIDRLGMSELKTEKEKEEMLFKSAERLFNLEKYGSAANALQRFLSQYPDGPFTARATLYMAECLENTGRLETAADIYRRLSKSKNSCSAQASEGLARIAYALNNYEEAAEAFGDVAESASDPDSKVNACLGRMRSNYGAGKYDAVLKDASFLANAPQSTPQVVREARYMMAKSYMHMGERSYAQPLYEDLAGDVDDRFGAESKYLLVQWAYDQGDLLKVQSLVTEFNAAKSPQQYWLARSVIVLGDSYRDMDDFRRAVDTYEALLSNYVPGDDNDDIPELLRKRINKLNGNRR